MNRRRLILFLAVLAGGLALDLWSKEAAFRAVPTRYDKVEVVKGFFYLVHVRNPGMAWSLFQGVGREIWIVLRTVLTGALLIVYFRKRDFPLGTHVAFASVIAGALGNLYDNCFAQDGHVRDFLLFYFGGWPFPVFNVADSLITVGAPFLFWHFAKADRAAELKRRAEAAASVHVSDGGSGSAS